jgi:PAS domain S-box-containing protein
VLLTGFIVLAALIIGVAYWAWWQQAGSIRAQAEESLVAMSEIKADQISGWLQERRSDAEAVSDDPLLAQAVADLLAGKGGPRTEADVRARLASLQAVYDYVDVVLTTPEGAVILREPATIAHALGAHAEATAAKAASTGEVQSTDLYVDEEGDVRIEWAAPLLPAAPGGTAVAAVLMHGDPDDYLYPLLAKWPSPSESGETLLVERRGDRVVYLSDLRARDEDELTLGMPLSRDDLPAVKAARGARGVVEGIDYRGVPVLAAVHAVHGSPWYVVAKEDSAEILSPIAARGWATAGFAFVAVALAAAGTLLLWRSREAQVARELLAREAEFSSLFDGMAEGVAMHELIRDGDGEPVDYRITSVNPAYTAQTGVAAAAARGRLATEVYDAAEAPYLDVYATTVEDGQSRAFQVYFEPLERHFRISVVAQGDDRFATIFEDITERTRYEERLAASEERFRYVFETALVGMSMTEPTGEIHVNAAFCEMLGYTPTELELKRWQDLTPPEDVPEIEGRLRPLLAGEQDATRFQKRYVRSDGGILWADVSVRLRRDAEGKPLHFITAVLDITPRVAAEEQIRRLNEELEQRVFDRTAELAAANKELEAFAYSVSHDLRAPLRHVGGFSALLSSRAGGDLDEKSRHYLERISTSIAEMGKLIDDLLQFSRTGRAELKMERVDMDALVAEALGPLRDETRDRDVEWRVAPLPAVIGDQALLRQVWVNLLGNAAKYTRGRSPARVEVGAEAGDHSDVYFVRDNGVGFDMDYAHKLFGVFQRLHNSEEFEGTGIGLANVQRIVSRLGGRVWAEGEMGKGATFFFSLPRRKEMTS